MSVIPERLSESLAGRYHIERELGAGGMATVYLAHDVRHDRQVALKVVKPEIVASVGAARFLDEIRTTAHLRHPHVLPLFDSGSVDDVPFFVMPYIDGESLRACLRREGPLPIATAVTILREVADALAYAHTQGVVHRDVKPDNVLLSGRHVFLADFGVARAFDVGTLSNQATAMTAMPTIVGTPAYMAPEQATGRTAVDHRADIYGYGVMAYKMIAGVPPFHGQTPTMVLAAHLNASPDPLIAHRPDAPPALAALIMRCLAKRPEDRWQRMEDLLGALDGQPAASDVAPALQRGRGTVFNIAVGASLVVFIVLAAAWLLMTARKDPPLAIGALKHVTRDPGLELDPAISPDGRTLAFVAGAPGQRRVYVQQIAGGRAIALTAPDVASSQRRPDWSPDGSKIVFQAGQQGFGVRVGARNGALYTIPALGGTPQLLLPPGGDGIAMTPSWSPDGSQVAYAAKDGLFIIPAAGGSPRRVLTSASDVHSPRWSPDGARLAYVSGGIDFVAGEDQLGNTETSSIHVVDVPTGADTTATSGQWLDVSPLWMNDGRGLLFVSSRGGGRDVYRLRLSRTGAPQGEAERVTSGLNAHGISLSHDGKLLAYSSLAIRANIWSLAIPAQAVSAADAQQVTFGSEKTEKMIVSRDGRWLAFDSDRSGNADVWKLRLSGGEPEQVTRSPDNEFANDWSPDGQEIVFHAIRPGTNRDVMTITADGTRTSVVVATSAEEQHGSWSPDGNSIAFSGGQTAGDVYNVFVTSRAGRDAAWGSPRQLTYDTGVDPKWSPDGRHIVYTRQGEVRLMTPDGGDDHVLVGASAADRPLAQYAIWSPDSNTIYFKASDTEQRASIWAVPASGGAPRLLVRFDDPSRRSLRREFATDGTRFFFTIAQDESDIWVADVH